MLDDSTSHQEVGSNQVVGWTLWVVGMAIELTADCQKHVFRSNKANKDAFINTGLGSISR